MYPWECSTVYHRSIQSRETGFFSRRARTAYMWGIWRWPAAGKVLVVWVATICAAAILCVAYRLLFGG